MIVIMIIIYIVNTISMSLILVSIFLILSVINKNNWLKKIKTHKYKSQFIKKEEPHNWFL